MGIAVRLATEDDLDSWMRLVDRVRSTFPGLESEREYSSYRETVRKFVARGTAICAVRGVTVVGVLLFSPNRNLLCCLAVDPDSRRHGVATRMIEHMLGFFDDAAEIRVSTFREGDERGLASRALYKKMGFREGALRVEFDYPHQEFVLGPRSQGNRIDASE